MSKSNLRSILEELFNRGTTWEGEESVYEIIIDTALSQIEALRLTTDELEMWLDKKSAKDVVRFPDVGERQ